MVIRSRRSFIPAHEICGIGNDGKIDIHLVVRVALVMKFFGGTLARRIAFASSFVRKASTMGSLMRRKFATNLRTNQILPNFANNELAHKERYVSIDKTAATRLRAGLLRLAIP